MCGERASHDYGGVLDANRVIIMTCRCVIVFEGRNNPTLLSAYTSLSLAECMAGQRLAEETAAHTAAPQKLRAHGTGCTSAHSLNYYHRFRKR